MTAATTPLAWPDDHARGPDDAPVTLIEYGNYECLHCRRSYPFIEALRAELGDRLRFAYRHFAHTADFPGAERAAEAAEAAGAQGKFWEMHERLFVSPPVFHREALLAHAADLGLDVRRVRAELIGHVHRERVRADLARGLEAGVRATPSFFINGAAHEAAWDLDGVRAAVLAAVDRSSAEQSTAAR